MSQDLIRKTEPTVLEVIQALATDERVSVEKLAGLMELQVRMEARNAEREFNMDLAAAMAEMPTIRKNAVKDMGAKGSIPYATYEKLDKTIRPIERKYGFCRIFTTAPLEKPGTLMTCKLLHRGGHSISSTRYQPPDPGPGRNETQAIGSADSYARRYLTLALWNLVTIGADDDANSVDTLTATQLESITDMVNDCDLTAARLAKFLELMHATSLDTIKRHEFDRAMETLRKALRAKEPK
jgi:hypothetical protein